jgi:hypothetical protein
MNGENVDQLDQHDIYALIQTRDELRKIADPLSERIDSFIKVQVKSLREANVPEEIPGLFSGRYEGPTEPIAPGETMGHAVGREAIAAPGRALVTVASMPLGVAEAVLTPPKTAAEKASMLAGPAGLPGKRLIIDPMVEEWGKAIEGFKKPEPAQPEVRDRWGRVMHRPRIGPEPFLHAIAGSVPVVGPWVGGKISEAEKGHVGAIAEFPLEYAGFKGGGKLAGKIIGRKPSVDPQVALEYTGLGLRDMMTKADERISQVEKPIYEGIGKHAPPIDRAPYGPLLESSYKELLANQEKYGVSFPNVMDTIRERLPGKTPISWNELKDLRSAAGQVMAKASAPARLKAALAGLYEKATADLKKSADKVGLGQDFEYVNDLHRIRMRLREAFGDKVMDAATGRQALEALAKEEPNAKVVLPSLEPFGFNSQAALEAIKVSRNAVKSRFFGGRLWNHFLGGQLGKVVLGAAGLPYGLGYPAGAIAAEIAMSRGPKANLKSPAYIKGEVEAKGIVFPPPREPSIPTEPPGGPPGRPIYSAPPSEGGPAIGPPPIRPSRIPEAEPVGREVSPEGAQAGEARRSEIQPTEGVQGERRLLGPTAGEISEAMQEPTPIRNLINKVNEERDRAANFVKWLDDPTRIALVRDKVRLTPAEADRALAEFAKEQFNRDIKTAEDLYQTKAELKQLAAGKRMPVIKTEQPLSPPAVAASAPSETPPSTTPPAAPAPTAPPGEAPAARPAIAAPPEAVSGTPVKPPAGAKAKTYAEKLQALIDSGEISSTPVLRRLIADAKTEAANLKLRKRFAEKQAEEVYNEIMARKTKGKE